MIKLLCLLLNDSKTENLQDFVEAVSLKMVEMVDDNYQLE